MLKTITAALPTIIGTIVLMGWCFDSPFLERIGMHSVTMNPETAIGMVFSGLSMLLLQSRTAYSRKTLVVSILFASLVVLIGTVKIIDVALGLGWNLDMRLFAGEMMRGGAKKMAPNAAVDFVLIGCAILLSVPKHRLAISLSQILALISAFIAFLAIVGYAYGTLAFYGIGAFTPMALHTAFCFICFTIAILGQHGAEGIMSCINNDGPAGKMAHLFLPMAVLVPVALGAVNLLGVRAQLFSVEFANSLAVVSNVAVLFVLTWIGARLLYKQDLRRQEIEEELRYRASHDRLTGLANRGVFFEMLQKRINVMKRRGGAGFAVFYLDLDGFKQINDRMGHEAGDRLLIEMAAMFLKCTRGTDLVARMGGDEFTILFEEISDDSDIEILAARILENMPRLYGPDIPIGISISIGICFGKPDHNIPEDILREADAALYRAKIAGKGRYDVMQRLESV